MSAALSETPRPPSLIMDLWAKGRIKTMMVDAPTIARVDAAMREARHFVFTEQAVTHMGNLIMSEPDHLIDAWPHVRPPFDVMWIEHPVPPLMRAFGVKIDHKGGDENVGYLIDHGAVYSFSYSGKIDPEGTLMPHRYLLNKPWASVDALKDFAKKININDQILPFLFYGQAATRVSERARDMDDASLMGLFYHSIEMCMSPVLARNNAMTKYYGIMGTCAGDLRNVLTMLYLINRPGVATYAPATERRRTFAGGKIRTLPSYQPIDIRLDPRVAIRAEREAQREARASHPDRAAPAAHDVRGHWRRNRSGQAACPVRATGHAWLPEAGAPRADGNPPPHELCSCGARRWWVASHRRGSDATREAPARHYRVRP
jgi:hypothetical protein